MQNKSLFLVFVILSSSGFASRVGSVQLYRGVNDAVLEVSTECFVGEDGLVLRTSAGGMFDPDKLITNKRVSGKEFFGFSALEKKFHALASTPVHASKTSAGDVIVKYEARSFDKNDNPVAYTLFQKNRDGSVQERTDKQSKQYRAFLDSVCN